MSEPSDHAPAAPTERVVRVFISSTFRDMMRERDLLVKEVFPELRRKCAQRLVTFTEVDLRWGITEAQANEGQVLPLCLAEIERSRPYFIGLLGERYGWIPDAIRPDVLAREPWLREHVRGRTSVTELEILHGVLNNPEMQRHAFFYFRDPAYVNDAALTGEERRDLVERDIRADVERYGEAEATRRTAERIAKLAALKQRIRDSQLPLVDPYANPRALADLVRRQFDALIDRLYPAEQTPDLLAQERLAHEAHANNKRFACIDRPAHLAALNAFAAPAEHDGTGLVVTGESGGGKTVLLAAWARDWENTHPDDFLFQHYFGATPDSASPDSFVRRLLGELKSRFDITDSVPADPEKLRDALPLWLRQTMGKGRIVLVLDGLNHVQGSELDRRLLFLPRHLPPHVVVLASALPSPALDALRERGWTEYDLPRASDAEVDAMVGAYLTIHARTLEPELRHQLVTAPGAKNPLFLRTVLEELRQFGSFEQLPQRVRHYLEADNPKNLFLRVLARWQEDFDGHDPEHDQPTLDLVGRTLTRLWTARQGLSEPEWLDLLGDGRQPLPRALWTPLFLALEPHLSQRAGLYAFGHDFLRQAVQARFAPADTDQLAARLALAAYFERRESNSRKTAEYPWLLLRARRWPDLYNFISAPESFLAVCLAGVEDARMYWSAMEANSDFRLTTAFASIIRAPSGSANLLNCLQAVLRSTGHDVEACRLTQFFARNIHQLPNVLDQISALHDNAINLYRNGRLDEAMQEHHRVEALARQHHRLREVGLSLLEQALILKRQGRLDEALAAHQGANDLLSQAGDDANLLGNRFNQASVLRALNRKEEAEATVRECLSRARQLGRRDLTAFCLQNLSLSLIDRRDFDAAEALLLEKESICLQDGFKRALATGYGTRAEIFRQRGEPQTAMGFLDRKEAICKETNDQLELALTWANQAGILASALRDCSGALKRIKAAKRLAETCGHHATIRQIGEVETDIRRICGRID